MQVILTGISFNYGQGYTSAYDSVNLNFTTTGSTGINLNGYINVKSADYQTASGQTNGLVSLIKSTLVTDINAA